MENWVFFIIINFQPQEPWRSAKAEAEMREMDGEEEEEWFQLGNVHVLCIFFLILMFFLFIFFFWIIII